MLCNETSCYPNGIDPMIFFQDNNIDSMNIVNQYTGLILQGKYTEATDYINKQVGVYGYFASFLNAIENRIYNLQDYLLSKEKKFQPFIYYDGDDFPLELYLPGTHYVLSENEHTVLNEFIHDDLNNVNDVDGKLQVVNADNGIIWI